MKRENKGGKREDREREREILIDASVKEKHIRKNKMMRTCLSLK